MTTLPHQTWQDGLAPAKKGPVILQAATRRLAWTTTIRVAGLDYSAAAFVGQVRASPDSGTILASFTFGTPVFADDETTVTMSLAAGTGANSTGVLPADADMDGMEYFPFDVLITPSGGTQERFFAGLLPLSGYVTLP